jgi:hypothetical protein
MKVSNHSPFKLRDFRGVDPAHVSKLEACGLKTAEQLLMAGSTPFARRQLADETGIPEAVILELVQLSDLSRLPGVKGIRARLYLDAGVDSIETMADWEPEELRRMVSDYVKATGFDGSPPLPKEVSSTVANARKLPKVVEN